jgi:hypothetical protein
MICPNCDSVMLACANGIQPATEALADFAVSQVIASVGKPEHREWTAIATVTAMMAAINGSAFHSTVTGTLLVNRAELADDEGDPASADMLRSEALTYFDSAADQDEPGAVELLEQYARAFPARVLAVAAQRQRGMTQ